MDGIQAVVDVELPAAVVALAARGVIAGLLGTAHDPQIAAPGRWIVAAGDSDVDGVARFEYQRRSVVGNFEKRKTVVLLQLGHRCGGGDGRE